MSKKDNIQDVVIPILRELQAGLKSVKSEIRREIGGVRTELGLIQQQLVTINGTLHHQRSETARLEDRIARLEAHVRIDPETGVPLDTSPQH